MKMEIFEYTVCTNQGEVAGFNNLDHAKAFAKHLANEEHCNVDVIDSFTGELHSSLVCHATIAYTLVGARFEEVSRSYEVKEREW